MSLPSRESVESRLAVDGFPELVRHWHHFKNRHAESTCLELSSLVRRTQRHTVPFFGYPSAIAFGLLLASGMAAYIYLSIINSNLLELSGTKTGERLFAFGLWLWATTNLFFLFCYGLMYAQRYLHEPMDGLLADWIGWMLLNGNPVQPNHDSLPNSPVSQTPVAVMEQTQPSVSFHQTCNSGIPTLSQVGWSIWIERDSQGLRLRTAATPGEAIREWLVMFLGHKDPEQRKFIPGPYLSSLRDGKKSVSRFCALHAAQLADLRDQRLSTENGLSLLESLLEEELVSESEHRTKLELFLSAARKSCYLPDRCIEATLWKRDPFLDLTHQRQFYSSASLRGIERMGRGSKGRLGTIHYMINPDIFAIDFADRTGRRVRARAAKSTASTQHQRIENVLFVDGVEGTNSIQRDVLHFGIMKFAEHFRFSGVFYFQYPYNVIPRRMIDHVSKLGLRTQLEICVGNLRNREYLDAFGWPIEPLEYQHPKGTVIGYWFPIGNSPKKLGIEPRWHTIALQKLKQWSLWLLMGQSLMFGFLSTALVAPILLPILIVTALLGIGLHLRYQRSSLTGSLGSESTKNPDLNAPPIC